MWCRTLARPPNWRDVTSALFELSLCRCLLDCTSISTCRDRSLTTQNGTALQGKMHLNFARGNRTTVDRRALHKIDQLRNRREDGGGFGKRSESGKWVRAAPAGLQVLRPLGSTPKPRHGVPNDSYIPVLLFTVDFLSTPARWRLHVSQQRIGAARNNSFRLWTVTWRLPAGCCRIADFKSDRHGYPVTCRTPTRMKCPRGCSRVTAPSARQRRSTRRPV